jgi:hypothetical protein
MKKLLLIPLLAICLASAAAIFTIQVPLAFQFDYPTNALDTNLFFNFYQSTDLTSGNWSPFTNYAFTNLVATPSASDPTCVTIKAPATFWATSMFFRGAPSNALYGIEYTNWVYTSSPPGLADLNRLKLVK